MKKRKFNLLLNIATLCLCVAAIAFGVYSAKTASLNVSGTIGFNAHNVDYDVTGTIVGHSGTDGLPVTTAESLTKDASGNLVLGDRTFSDLGTSGEVETITVELTITNKSAFAIAVKVNLPESTTADSNIIIDSPKDYSAVILADKNATDSTTKTGKLQFTLNVKAGTQEIATTNAVSLKVDLAKTDIAVGTAVRADAPIKQFTSEYVNNLRTILNNLKINTGSGYLEFNNTVKCYAERYPYYVEMGEINNEKVRWLIVGTFNNDSVTALTSLDKTMLSNGYMLKDTTYVMLSEKVLYTESTTKYGISFQNNYSDDSTTTPAYKNASGYSAQDYATSNVRNYLKGADNVYRTYKSSTTYEPDTTSKKINLLTDYHLADDPLYAKIQGRTLESLYTNCGSKGTNAKIWTKDDDITEANLQSNTQDKLWLLSSIEGIKIFNFSADIVSWSYASSITIVSNSTNISDAAKWWLRDGWQDDKAEYVDSVGSEGAWDRWEAYCDEFGTRPAFLF